MRGSWNREWAKAAAGLLLAVAPAWAHHSFAAEFDASRPVRLEGTVARVDWANPHVHLYIDVKDREGKTIQWMIEGASPNVLLRLGFGKTSVAAGVHVILNGYPAKSGSHSASGSDIILPSGQKLLLHSNGDSAR